MTYLDETLQALDNGNVYVSATVQATSATPVNEAKLEKELDGSTIAVVILPSDALSEIDSIPAFISQIGANTNFQTILVAVGNDLDAMSSALNQQGLASTLANQAEQQHPGDLTAATEQFVASVQANMPAGDSGDDSIGVAGIGSIAVGAVVLVGGGVASWKAFKSYRKRSALRSVEQRVAAIRQLAESVSDGTTKHNLQEASYAIDKLVRLVLAIDDAEQRANAVGTVKMRYELALQQLESRISRLVKIQNNHVSTSGHTLDLSEFNKSLKSCTNAAMSDYEAIVSKSYEDFTMESISFQMLFPADILRD